MKNIFYSLLFTYSLLHAGGTHLSEPVLDANIKKLFRIQNKTPYILSVRLGPVRSMFNGVTIPSFFDNALYQFKDSNFFIEPDREKPILLKNYTQPNGVVVVFEQAQYFKVTVYEIHDDKYYQGESDWHQFVPYKKYVVNLGKGDPIPSNGVNWVNLFVEEAQVN